MSGTRTFKIGDKVRRIFGEHYGMKVGDSGVVLKVEHCGIKLEGYTSLHMSYNLELVEQAPSFNLKTQPWFIRVNNKEESKLAQEWLFSQGMCWRNGDSRILDWQCITSFTNTVVDGVIDSCLLVNLDNNFKGEEIKLNFKTTIESVEYPEVKTQQIKIEEQQSKIAEIEATIELAKQQISKLKEGKK